MLVQALAVAAAAASFAPNVLAQDAGAPEMGPVTDQAEICQLKLEANGTHSLADILEGEFVNIANNGEESVLAPLIAAVEPATAAILTGFDATGAEGYTLLMPTNDDGQGNLLTDAFDLNDTMFLEKADDIIRAHIIPVSLDFETFQTELNATGEYVATSLQGFEWTFIMDEDLGFAYIKDEWNVSDTTPPKIDIVADIRNEPDCPNRIIGVRGFVVSPEDLPEAPTPAPAPAPRALPPPTEPPVTPTAPPTTTPAPVPEPTPSGAGTFSTSGLAALSAVGAAALGAALL